MGLPKGYRHTEETKKKIGDAARGRKGWSRGKKLGPRSEETKQKLREAHKGKSYHSKGFQKGHKSFLSADQYKELGKKLKAIGHRPLPVSMAGEKHWNWKGGVSKERVRLCNTKQYKDWRKSVYQRDDYICQICFKRGGSLEAHHIKSWAKYPELRFEVHNGQTLCKNCHKIETHGRKK